MKVSLNTKYMEGSFGGGVHFAKSLRDFLEDKGVAVVNHLQDDDIDVILNITPFPFLMQSSSYSFYDAYAYKLRKPKTLILSRINNSDESRSHSRLNKLFYKVALYSDHLVYISNWVKELQSPRFPRRESSVIYNGADASIFNRAYDRQEPSKKIRIVTHHWSDNFKKGHGIYQQLDKMLDDADLRARFEFTYIGRYPENLVYRNTTMLAPMSGVELAKELSQHDVYLSAALHEAAGMHHIEGAMCGLPLLYLRSGALPEYCRGFGVEFQEGNFPEKLEEIASNLDQLRASMPAYPHSAKSSNHQFLQLFNSLYQKRDKFELGIPTGLRYVVLLVYRAYATLDILCFKLWHKVSRRLARLAKP